jgi:hypothetical protein
LQWHLLNLAERPRKVKKKNVPFMFLFCKVSIFGFFVMILFFCGGLQ